MLSLCESFADIQQEKVFSKSISRKKTEKHPGNWSGIVFCMSLSMKRYVESQLNNSDKGKNRTRRWGRGGEVAVHRMSSSQDIKDIRMDVK